MGDSTACLILMVYIDNETLARSHFNVGSRTDSRDTFLCVASAIAPGIALPPASMQSKEKYPKERRPGCRLILRSVVFAGGRRGKTGLKPAFGPFFRFAVYFLVSQKI